MGQVREVELTEADISAAVNETEKEIAGAAWDEEDTEALDSSGDRTLESMGEGLEGQHEAGEDESEDEESEEETESEEGDEESAGETQLAGEKKPEGEQKPVGQEDEPRGRVPAGRLREANERARSAEAERDAERTARAEESKKLIALEAQMATLTQLLNRQQQPPQQQPQSTRTVEPPVVPDIFENPQGFVEHITSQIRSELGGVRQDLQRQSVETSFRIAHVKHGDAFPEAMGAVNKLDPNNPDDKVTVQRIYNSSDPGEALIAWHKRNVALTRVGNDPDAYEARIRDETRKSLMNDPEFKKQFIASMRQDAQQGDDGRPRTTVRLPTSVGRASGSNVGASREHVGAIDDSDQAVADAAWR